LEGASNKGAGSAGSNSYQYNVYDPWNWEEEFYNNLKPRIDIIPDNLSEKDRIAQIDALILIEAKKLQDKYRTVYNSSDNILAKIFSPGLNKKIEPLYTYYLIENEKGNPYLQAALNGLSSGFDAGIWSEAFRGTGAGKNPGRGPGIKILKYPGNDPYKVPAKGYEWRGRGAQGSNQGNWYNPETNEWLRPDLNHPEPISPHWDYGAPDGKTYRIYPNGTYELK
jgi:hypothetical protein